MEYNMEQGEAAVLELDRIKALQTQVDGVKDIMTNNIDLMLDRESNLNGLEGKSKELQDGAQSFQHTCQKVARSYWWKDVKLVAGMVAVIVVILLVIVLLATGVIPPRSGQSPSSSPTPKP